MSSEKRRYPLSWPDGWRRSRAIDRVRAQFGKVSTNWNAQAGQSTYGGKSRLSIADGLERLAEELRRSGVNEDGVIVSTNVPTRLDGLPRSDRAEPADPGVAVYWKRKGKDQCMAIDRYDRVADNLNAVAATLEALRAVERHGGGAILDRAFQGFAQLPAAIITQRAWRDVLRFAANALVTMAEVEERFREMAKKHHSDVGGEDDRMRELLEARNAARREISGVGAGA